MRRDPPLRRGCVWMPRARAKVIRPRAHTQCYCILLVFRCVCVLSFVPICAGLLGFFMLYRKFSTPFGIYTECGLFFLRRLSLYPVSSYSRVVLVFFVVVVVAAPMRLEWQKKCLSCHLSASVVWSLWRFFVRLLLSTLVLYMCLYIFIPISTKQYTNKHSVVVYTTFSGTPIWGNIYIYI